jgi:hypothetical protein
LLVATSAFVHPSTKVNCALAPMEVLNDSNTMLNNSAFFEIIKPSSKVFELSTENNFDLFLRRHWRRRLSGQRKVRGLKFLHRDGLQIGFAAAALIKKVLSLQLE